MDLKDNMVVSSLQIRPRFKIESGYKKEHILQLLDSAVSGESSPVVGKVVTHHVVLNIPPEQQHYWSPQLHLEVEDYRDGSLIRGLFGPKPTVWTFFVFIYSVIGLFGLITLTFGLSKWMLGEVSFWLWGIPLSILASVVVYFVARTGQHLGREQMGMLKDFLDQTIAQ